MHTLLHEDATTSVTPSRRRRVALVAVGFLSCALPIVFTLNISRMLVVGELSGHRFHQLTGQGLLLFLLWFAGLVPLLRAGWVGRRPSTAAGLLHLTFVGVGLASSVAAPGGGAPILTGVIAVTGALVWAALPVRPRLRTGLRVDPLLAPLALLMAALQTPYAVGQVALQNRATGHHAQNPHYFDMAWLVMVVVVLGLLGAVVPVARRLSLWSAAVATGTGMAGVALGESLPWSVSTLVLGLVTGTVGLLLASWPERRSVTASAL
jgi:hypothetical protein